MNLESVKAADFRTIMNISCVEMCVKYFVMSLTRDAVSLSTEM